MKQTIEVMSKSNIEKFWERVDMSGGKDSCWNWKGQKIPKGYGTFCITRRPLKHSLYAHRTALELVKGKITENLVVCHRCDNPSCCNPDHLFLGTPKENTADARKKKRLSGPKKKITDQAKLQIMEMRKLGFTLRKIATKFNVTPSAISLLCNDGIKWTQKKRESLIRENPELMRLARKFDEQVQQNN